MIRFTIRDMLWLTVVIAMGLAWWISAGRLSRSVAKFEREALERHREIFILRLADNRHLAERDALLAAIHSAGLDDEVDKSLGKHFKAEMERRGMPIEEER